jgi:hypothetical protein
VREPELPVIYLIVLYGLGAVIALPIIYRAFWNELDPEIAVDIGFVGFVSLIFAALWPLVVIPAALYVFFAPKGRS